MGSFHLWLWMVLMECVCVGSGGSWEQERQDHHTSAPRMGQELGQEEEGATVHCQDRVRITTLLFWVQEAAQTQGRRTWGCSG